MIYSIIVTLALVAVSSTWLGLSFTLPNFTASDRLAKLDYKLPLRVVASKNIWHASTCMQYDDQPCVEMTRRPFEPEEETRYLNASQKAHAMLVAQDFVSLHPHFTLTEKPDVVLFRCCARLPHDEIGIVFAESQQMVLTVEPAKPEYGLPNIQFAVSNKRHCTSPQPLPFAMPVRFIPPQFNAWPGHFHVFLHLPENSECVLLDKTHVPIPPLNPPRPRADVPYLVQAPPPADPVVVGLYKFTKQDKDKVEAWIALN